MAPRLQSAQRWSDASGFPAAGGVTGETDRNDQRPTLKDRLDEERIAQLLQSGDADSAHQHCDDGAGSVDAARPYGRRPEQRPDKGWQQKLRPNRALRHLQTRREDDARETDQQAGTDEAAHDQPPRAD